MAKGANFYVSVPTREEIERLSGSSNDEIPATDFAIATGAMHESHPPAGSRPTATRIWSCNAAGRRGKIADKIYAYVHENALHPFNATQVSSAGIGVVPVFRNPGEGGMRIEHIQGRDLIVIDDRVAFYPQVEIGGGLGAIALEKIEKDKATKADFLFHSIQPAKTLVGGTTIKSHFYDVYTTAELPRPTAFVEDTRGEKKLFGLAPIEAARTKGGDIIATSVLFAAPMGLPKIILDTFKKHNVRDGDEIDTEITSFGTFLRAGFTSDMIKATEAINLSAHGDRRVEEEKLRAAAPFFRAGMRVKIKCEGREGAIRTVSTDGKIATVAIDGGKGNLRYRVEDLEIKE